MVSMPSPAASETSKTLSVLTFEQLFQLLVPWIFLVLLVCCCIHSVGWVYAGTLQCLHIPSLLVKVALM